MKSLDEKKLIHFRLPGDKRLTVDKFCHDTAGESDVPGFE